MKRTPRQGDPYSHCLHLAADAQRTDRHFWQVPPHEPWIVLCDDCHAAFSERRPIEMHGETQTLSADVPIEPSCIEHEKPRTQRTRRRRPAPTREDLAAALTELESRAPVPRGWQPDATLQALRTLHRTYKRIAPPASLVESVELGWLKCRIDELEFRSRLALKTLARWRRLLAQIQAFAERVRQEPGRAYAYRRRRHRKLLARKQDLETLLRVLGVALPITDSCRAAPALKDLATRFRPVPPSPAEQRAIRASLTLADRAATEIALATCSGEICAAQRGERAPSTIGEQTVETCPGGACAALRKALQTAGPAWASYSAKNGGVLNGLLVRLRSKNLN